EQSFAVDDPRPQQERQSNRRGVPEAGEGPPEDSRRETQSGVWENEIAGGDHALRLCQQCRRPETPRRRRHASRQDVGRCCMSEIPHKFKDRSMAEKQEDPVARQVLLQRHQAYLAKIDRITMVNRALCLGGLVAGALMFAILNLETACLFY